MTIQELIEELQKVKDKSVTPWFYDSYYGAIDINEVTVEVLIDGTTEVKLH